MDKILKNPIQDPNINTIALRGTPVNKAKEVSHIVDKTTLYP